MRGNKSGAPFSKSDLNCFPSLCFLLRTGGKKTAFARIIFAPLPRVLNRTKDIYVFFQVHLNFSIHLKHKIHTILSFSKFFIIKVMSFFFDRDV